VLDKYKNKNTKQTFWCKKTNKTSKNKKFLTCLLVLSKLVKDCKKKEKTKFYSVIN